MLFVRTMENQFRPDYLPCIYNTRSVEYVSSHHQGSVRQSLRSNPSTSQHSLKSVIAEWSVSHVVHHPVRRSYSFRFIRGRSACVVTADRLIGSPLQWCAEGPLSATATEETEGRTEILPGAPFRTDGRCVKRERDWWSTHPSAGENFLVWSALY